jgi:hypothetical protein
MFDLPNDDGEKEKSECNRRWCEPANRKPVMIELSKYAFETLRKDEQFAFCRGRSDEGELPTILLVAPVPEHPVPAILERLEHEYSLRDELDPEWSVRSIGLTRHWDRLVLVMEDPGGIPLEQLLGHQSARREPRPTDPGGEPLDRLLGPARNPSPHSLREALRARTSALANAGGQPLELSHFLRFAADAAAALGGRPMELTRFLRLAIPCKGSCLKIREKET